VSEEIPKVLGRYQIQKELGRGMMGVVYRAQDPDLGRLVALKTIKLAFSIPEGEKAAFEKRFLAEARAAAGLQHPGIVVVHDVGRDAATDTVYIALEYLEGHTLAEATADGTPMDWRQALRIAEKLADALHHAHAKGIVHRDIKPANIMVMASSGHPKVMDFGIAKLPASTLTTAGEFFGTPSFMSPEQAGGQTALDGRSDLFSLGCVLYQLLTGKRAFDGGTLPAILMRVMKDDPVPPTQAVPGLPAPLDALVGKALAKDKAHRYQTGQQMAEDVQDVLAGRPPRHAGSGAVRTAVAAATAQGDTRETGLPDTRPTEGPGLASARLGEMLSAAAGTSVLREGPRTGLRRRHLLLIGALAAGALLFTGGVAAYLFVPRGGQPAPLALPTIPPVLAPARLEVSLVHSLGAGSVKVWVDDDVVLDRPIEGRVTKKVLNFRVYKGSFNETVDVKPGERTVRIQVTGDNYSEVKRIRGGFASGMSRILRAEVTAWPKRDLRISWGS
jgi:tRNA A-37 threonylcarbamoyl transferase component Bud32